MNRKKVVREEDLCDPLELGAGMDGGEPLAGVENMSSLQEKKIRSERVLNVSQYT